MKKKLLSFSKNLTMFIKVYFGVMAGAVSYYLIIALCLAFAYYGFTMAKANGASGFPYDTDFSKLIKRNKHITLKPVFQPYETFQGPFPGYVYKTGSKGLGYYPDINGIVESFESDPTDPTKLLIGKILFYIFGGVAFVLLLPTIINYLVLILTTLAIDL